MGAGWLTPSSNNNYLDIQEKSKSTWRCESTIGNIADWDMISEYENGAGGFGGGGRCIIMNYNIAGGGYTGGNGAYNNPPACHSRRR